MTRTLYLTHRSPYARKVRILLEEKGLTFEPKVVDLQHRSPDFVAISPLGKLPVLIDEDQTVIFDSTVIAEYLDDRYPEHPFYGQGYRERLLCRLGEELGDTVSDQAVAAFHARAAKDEAAHLKAFDGVGKALIEIVRRKKAGLWPSGFTIADVSVLSAIGYLELRHGRALLDPHAGSLAWLKDFAERPSVRGSVPVLDR